MAVTTAVWLLDTVAAVAVKLAVVEPFDTVTVPGTARAVALLDSVTTAPPLPAAIESVTTQVDATPELRLVGAQVSDVKAGGVAARVTDCVSELPL